MKGKTLLSKNMIIANVSNARGMLEQVVKDFHRIYESNLDFFFDDNDFLDIWDTDQKVALMLDFEVAIYSILPKE